MKDAPQKDWKVTKMIEAKGAQSHAQSVRTSNQSVVSTLTGNDDDDDSHTSSSSQFLQVCSPFATKHQEPRSKFEGGVMLDNQTDASLFKNRHMLSNIHTVDTGLEIQTNTGTGETNKKALFHNYPVWFREQGIANVLY